MCNAQEEWESYDKNNLERQPAAVSDQPLPCNVFQANRIHEGGKEASATTKELEDGDALSALGEREEFNEVRCS